MGRKFYRNPKGISLPTIVALGVISSMWLLSTASLVTGSFGKVVKERTGDLMRNSAEAGLDWAVAQLNDPACRANVDGATVPIPQYALSNPNFTGTVTVTNAPAPPGSYLYDKTTDWSLSNNNPQPAPTAANSISDGNGWRAVTATISNGIFSKSIRVILKPVYASITKSATAAGDPVPYVYTGIATPGNYFGGGNPITSAYTSTPAKPQPVMGTPPSGANKGDILANGTIVLSGNTLVGGTVTSASDASLAIQGGPNVKIGGLLTNGGTTISNSNVYGGGDYIPNQVTGVAAKTFPAPPSAPTTAVPKTINLTLNNTMTLSAGDYVASSIAIAGNARLTIDSTNGPINIYVTGNGSSNGITIGGNGISNNSQPGNLRIWYSGNGNVQLSGNGTLSAVIYAPNAPVLIRGNGNIVGAVVGASIDEGANGSIVYDNALTSSGPMYYPTTQTTINGQSVQAFQTVSWYEF